MPRSHAPTDHSPGTGPIEAEAIADQCLYETGLRNISAASKEVALIGLLVIPDGAISMREYRRRMKLHYLRSHPECGSFFVLFVLPVLISLVSNWVAKWIIDRADVGAVRMGAFDALRGYPLPTTGTRTSTSSQTKTPSEQEK